MKKTEKITQKEFHGQEFVGKVVALSSLQTVRVRIGRLWKHPLYDKAMRRSSDFLCHLEGMECAVGDSVRIRSCKPISKKKHFRVVEKITL